jgi:hypothetical protein
MLVYWSVDRGGNEPGGNFLTDFFTRTRWARAGKFIK